MIEWQTVHIVKHIERIAREGLAWVDVKAERMAENNAKFTERPCRRAVATLHGRVDPGRKLVAGFGLSGFLLVDRRRILLWLGAFCALPFSYLAFLRPNQRGRQLGPASLRPALEIDFFSDVEGTRQIAQRYLELHPAEAAREQLERRVEDRLRGTRARSAAELRTAIAKEVQLDFAEGQIVLLDGWVVSLLEARLCVLYSVT